LQVRVLPGAPQPPSSVANYRGAIDRYVLPTLGKAKLREVDAATLDALYAQVRAHGGRCRVCWTRVRGGEPPLRAGERYRPEPDATEQVHEPDCVRGGPLSASAVREVHTVLSGAFKQAVGWGWTGHNPAKLATPPSAGKGGVSPPAASDVARLLAAAMAEDLELGLFLRLAVVLGARRGELCGLKWRDVDLAAGAVLIASSVARIAGSVARIAGRPLLDKDTKTHAKRRVAVGAETAELLKAHRLRQAEAALACGASLPPGAYVFSRSADASTPVSPEWITHRLQDLADRLGVRCRLHDLRHFMVTQLVAAQLGPQLLRGHRRSAPRGWPTAATRAVVALRLVVSSARSASRSPRRRGMAGRSWTSASRAARTASSASLLAPLRLAGRLGRPTSTTRSPRCCNTAVRPAPKLPAPSTAQQRRPGRWRWAKPSSCW
jgi:integrase